MQTITPKNDFQPSKYVPIQRADPPPHPHASTPSSNNRKEDEPNPNQPAAPRQKLSTADSALLPSNTRFWRKGRRGRGRGRSINNRSSRHTRVVKSTDPITTHADTPIHQETSSEPNPRQTLDLLMKTVIKPLGNAVAVNAGQKEITGGSQASSDQSAVSYHDSSETSSVSKSDHSPVGMVVPTDDLSIPTYR